MHIHYDWKRWEGTSKKKNANKLFIENKFVLSVFDAFATINETGAVDAHQIGVFALIPFAVPFVWQEAQSIHQT